MYGTTQKETPNAKGMTDHRQKLHAIFELKGQLEEIKESMKSKQDNDEALKKLHSLESDIVSLTRMISKIQTQFDELQDKQEHQITDLYDSIEQYISTATPRNIGDLDELKNKLFSLESKVDKLDKITTDPHTSDNRPKTKFMRPSQVSAGTNTK